MITGLPNLLHFLIKSFEPLVLFQVEFQHPCHHEQPLIHQKLQGFHQCYQYLLGSQFRENCDMCFSSSRIWRISKTSLGRLTKLAAIKSTFSLIPKRMSSASLSVIPGKLTFTPGKLTPFYF